MTETPPPLDPEGDEVADEVADEGDDTAPGSTDLTTTDDDVLDGIEDITAQIHEALEWVEVGDDGTPHYLFVQSVVIADAGRAVFRLRWNGDSYRYEPSPLLDSDGR